VRPLRRALTKLWAPIPWMLEAAVVLELVLGKYVEATIIATLLAFNAALGFFQEGHAQATLAALKSRLALNAAVKRDNAWKTVPATELVVGDVVKLSLGAVVAADVRLIEGSVLIDQSMLTGESVPVEAGAGFETYAGALVRRGEAVAEVTATGLHTKFGRTAELVRTAHVESSQQKAVLRVVRNLAMVNGVLILIMLGYAWALKMPGSEIVPLVLTGVLASIPVALPATFTLAAALGARALAKLDVLPTRLSAVDEAASIDVLCADKTGTLTQNELTVTSVHVMSGFDESHVLGLAARASSDSGQDPVDTAVRAAAATKPAGDLPKLNQVHTIRSRDKDVGGGRGRFGRRPGAYRKGSLRRGRGPCGIVARRVCGGDSTGGAGLSRSGRCDRGSFQTTAGGGGDETGWDYCSQRSPPV
jgi:H+-transporting ATPase